MLNYKHIKHWNFSNSKNFLSALFSYVYLYFKEFKNPISVLLFKMGVKNKINLKFKDYKIDDLTLISEEKHIVTSYINSKFNYGSKYIKLYQDVFNQINSGKEFIDFKGIIIPNEPKYVWLFFEFFGSYDLIDYNGRTVIDIGSNIGDTSLNFANEGAEVYAYEVVPYIYELSQKFLDFNKKLKDHISYYNKAVTFKGEGQILISYDEDDANIGSASIYSKEENNFFIDTINIKSIINENKIIPDVLKMDCEGCEYNIILKSDLSDFKDIILEYHHVDNHTPEELIEKLENEGFKIRNYPDKLIRNLGIIHASK